MISKCCKTNLSKEEETTISISMSKVCYSKKHKCYARKIDFDIFDNVEN